MQQMVRGVLRMILSQFSDALDIDVPDRDDLITHMHRQVADRNAVSGHVLAKVNASGWTSTRREKPNPKSSADQSGSISPAARALWKSACHRANVPAAIAPRIPAIRS